MKNSVEDQVLVVLKNRRSRLLTVLEQEKLDCILVEHIPNLRYLSGFSGSEAALLITANDCWIVCDSRYTVQAGLEAKGLHIVERSQRVDAIRELQAAKGWKRIGFEAEHTTVAHWEKLSSAVGSSEFVAVPGGLDPLRSVKGASELKLLSDVASIASDSFLGILPLVRPGATELELSVALEFEMRRRGADGRAFDFIVASGERGAMPHGRATDRRISSGELVTFDYGALLHGYNSDETVTIAVGEPDNRSREIYGVVLAAHDMAIEAVKPGIKLKELDAVARSYIAEKGYGDYFGHGLGHGLGLEVHEKPSLSPRSDGLLECGMVVTIEPGIYIPGWGGVRIEDTVVVTDDGCDIITTVPKDIMVV